jgi:hypothetical protein
MRLPRKPIACQTADATIGNREKSETMTKLPINRVVIACDSVGENRSSIEAAARLANWFEAALHGIFLEDEALLHLSAIPSVRHIGPGGENFGAITERTVLHQFEAYAGRMRATVETAARTRELDWSFDVVRGAPDLAILDMRERDLLVIEAESRAFAGGTRLASRLLAPALQSTNPILLLRSRRAATHDVVTLMQSTGLAAAQFIANAARLAQAGNRSLTLFLAKNVCEEPTALNIVRSFSPELARRCFIVQANQSTLGNIATEGRLLIVRADPATNVVATLKDLLASTRADILFLR